MSCRLKRERARVLIWASPQPWSIKVWMFKRYFKIDQYLARHFVYYYDSLWVFSKSPYFSMQSNNYHFSKFNDLQFQPIVEPLYPYSSSSVESLLNDLSSEWYSKIEIFFLFSIIRNLWFKILNNSLNKSFFIKLWATLSFFLGLKLIYQEK